MNQEQALLAGPIKKVYLRYLLPTVVGMLTSSVYCLVDVMFIGRCVGSQGLAALNIAMPVYTIYTAIGLLFGVGGATTFSVFIGQGDKKMVDKVFSFTVYTCLAVGLVLTLLGMVLIRPFASLLGATDALMPYVLDYMRPLMITTFLFILVSCMQVIIRADYNPKLVMAATVFGNLINIVFDYIFVGVMGMGMIGASIATAMGPCCSILLLSFHYLRKKNTMHFCRKCMDLSVLKRVLQNGTGTFILELSAGAVIFLFNYVLLRVSGEDAVAVYAIISNIAYVGKGVFNGISQAAQPIISVNYGAGQKGRCREAFAFASFVTVVFSLVAYLCILLFPKPVVSVFLQDGAAILDHGARAAQIYFFSFLFTGMNTVLMYYFQSMEKIPVTILISVARGFILIVAGLLIFPGIFGENGVWITMSFAEIVTLMFAIFYKKRVER